MNPTTDSATTSASDFQEILTTVRSQTGTTLGELSEESPVLLVFLRHSGCTFCREALSDIAARRQQIESQGTQITLVHMTTDERAARFFEAYGLADLPRFSDPEQRLYRAFDLQNGSLWQLFGPAVLWRGFKAGLFGGHGVGRLEGNGFRLPGTFLMHKGKILRAFRSRNAAERPDYREMACSIEPSP